MSINRNRAKLNKAKTNKEYLAIQYTINYPPYWDECIPTYPRYGRGTSKDRKKYYRKQKMGFEMRMYKTWKHSRKTKWKE